MRELTPYEKEKWFNEYGSFDWEAFTTEGRYGTLDRDDIFLLRGDEYGEAFDKALVITNKEDMLGDEFARHAQVIVLDMYYNQIVSFYIDGFDDPEEHGLPSDEDFRKAATQEGVTKFAYYNQPRTDEERMMWDWAIEQRKLNWKETMKVKQIERLEHQLSVLRGEEDGA